MTLSPSTSTVAHTGLALCDCGHPAGEHAEGYICTHKLDTWPEGGWYGVCPCVRYAEDERGTLTPDRMVENG